MRDDSLELASFARSLGIPVALSPSVTGMLTVSAIDRIRAAGVKAVSISLDGATPRVHEGIRGIDGHFESTLAAIRLLRRHGLVVQVNTTVMQENVEELPELVSLLHRLDVNVWEVFLLVRTGRGESIEELTPQENEDLCHFLYDASRYGFVVRTVEAPFFRRVVAARNGEPPAGLGPLYQLLSRSSRRTARGAAHGAEGAHEGHARRQGNRLRRLRRRGLPGRLSAALARERPAGGAAPRSTARARFSARHPRRRVPRTLRLVRVHRSLRRLARSRLCGDRRSRSATTRRARFSNAEGRAPGAALGRTGRWR